jgi:DNA-binding transcriptional MerR regulator
LFNLSHRSLRFYEEKGLLKANETGRHRRYSKSDVERIKVIVYLKHMGFSLKRIREVVERPAQPQISQLSHSIVNCEQRIADLERQRADIDLALAELRRTVSQLKSAQFAEQHDAGIPAADPEVSGS